MRSESTKDRYLSRTHTDTQKFIYNYDYIPRHDNRNNNCIPVRDNGLSFKNSEHNRSLQMNVIQNKRNALDEIKREGTLSLQKYNMSNLLSGLKTELGMISNHIKDTNRKVDDYLQKTSYDDYLSQKIKNKKYALNYSSTNDFKTSQKSIQNSSSLKIMPMKNDLNNLRLKELRSDCNKGYTTNNYMNNLVKKYQSSAYIDNGQNDKSFTYQYESPQNDRSFDEKKYMTSFKPNAYQDKLVSLEDKLESTNKVIPELTEQVNYYKHSYEAMKSDKEKAEHRFSVLENELIESKQRFSDEIQMKNNYLAMINNSSMTIEKNERALNDYENQIKLLQKHLKEKNEEMVINQDNYTKLLNSLVNEKEKLKTAVHQLETKHFITPEIRQFHEMLSQKEAELIEAKLLNDELRNKIHDITEENANEQNKMINKMALINNNDNRDNAKLIEEKEELKEKISRLHLVIEQLSDDNIVKQDELSQQQYNTIQEEYKRYQIETNLQNEKYRTQIENLIETNNQLKSDSEKKNDQIHLLSTELSNKKSEVSSLTNEISSLKEQIEKIKYQLEINTTSNKDQMKELIEDNNQLNGKLKELEGEIQNLNERNDTVRAQTIEISDSKEIDKAKEALLKEQMKYQTEKIEMKTIIDKLESDIEVYQNEFKISKDRNDFDNEQMQVEYNQTIKEIQENNENLKKQIDELNIQLLIEKKSAEKFKEESCAKENKIEELKAGKIELENQYDLLKNSISTQIRNKDEEGKERELLINEIEKLKNEVNDYKEEQSKAKNELNNSLQTINQLNEAIAQIKKENGDNKTIILSFKATIDELESELKVMKKKEDELQTKNNELSEDYNKKTTEIETDLLQEKRKLVDELQLLKEEISQLKQKEINLEQENKNQAQTIKQLEDDKTKDNIQELNLKLITQEAVISNLNIKIEEMTKQENEATNAKTANLQSQLEDKEKRIEELNEENNKMAIEITKVQSLEIQNQKLKAENQSTFSQLKSQIDNNKELLAQLDHQKEEIEQILLHGNNPLRNSEQANEAQSDDFPQDLLKSDSFEHQEEIDNLYKTIDQCKETIISLQSTIEQKSTEMEAIREEKNQVVNELSEAKVEIEEFKRINDKLIQTNSELKADREGSIGRINNRYRQTLTKAEEINEEDIETLHLTIANLRELVNEKDQEVIELQKKQIEIETEEGIIRQTDLSKISSSNLTDAEKCVKYRERLESCKIQQKSDQDQIVFLKNEIKELNGKIAQLKSFEGKITSYDEFVKLYQIAIENYKPKKKDQEEALKKIEEHLSLHETDESSSATKKQKKGIFNKLFK